MIFKSVFRGNSKFVGKNLFKINFRHFSGLLSVEKVEKLLEKDGRNDTILLLDTVYQAKDNAAEFVKEHIGKAQHFDIEKVVYKTQTKRRNLTHPLVFQEYARSLGVNRDSFVILYDHGEEKNSIISATYAHWLFQVYGHREVAIMNGGLAAWKARGLPLVEMEKPPNPRARPYGNFLAEWNPNFIATFRDILSHVDGGGCESENVHLLDARNAKHFSGESKMGLAKDGGRIPGSKNVPVAEFVTEDGFLIDSDSFREVLRNRGVVDSDVKGAIAYCNTAFQSSALHFLLQSLGIGSKNYDGSWVEWSHLAEENLKQRG